MKVMVKYGSKNEKAEKAWMEWRPAIVPLVALIGVGVLPGMLKGLYEPYSTELVAGHIPLIILFIGAVLGALSVMVFRDLLSRHMSAFMAFRWRPGESYLVGRRHSQKKEEKRGEEKKG
jgi:hypothetical protein